MLNSLIGYALDTGCELIDINQICNQSYGRILTNPSCIFYNNKLIVNCRSVDYIKTFKNAEYDLCLSGMNQDYSTVNTINSINISVDITNGDSTIIDIPHGVYSRYSGLEDGRLIIWNDKLYIYGTRWDVVNGRGMICLYELNDNLKCTDNRVIETYYHSQCEKNWCAIEDKPFQFMYTTEPQTIIQPIFHFNTSHFIVKEKHVSDDLIGARGNTNIVRLDKNRYIQLIHNSVYTNEDNTNCLHYKFKFVIYDNNFNILRISNEFNFMYDLCEFSCGLCFDEDNAYITFSEIDASAYLLKISRNDLIKFIYSNEVYKYNWTEEYEKKAKYFFDNCQVKNSIPFYNVVNNDFNNLIVLTYYITQMNYMDNRVFNILKSLYEKSKMVEYLLLLAIVYKRNNDLINYKKYKEIALNHTEKMNPIFLSFINIKTL